MPETSKPTLSLSDCNLVNMCARSISKREDEGISQEKLQECVYKLGLYAYRLFHGKGLPVDLNDPSKNAPNGVYCKEIGMRVSREVRDHVNERIDGLHELAHQSMEECIEDGFDLGFSEGKKFAKKEAKKKTSTKR